eukprot:641131-Pyramimonas_sp.AAC.1
MLTSTLGESKERTPSDFRRKRGLFLHSVSVVGVAGPLHTEQLFPSSDKTREELNTEHWRGPGGLGMSLRSDRRPKRPSSLSLSIAS